MRNSLHVSARATRCRETLMDTSKRATAIFQMKQSLKWWTRPERKWQEHPPKEQQKGEQGELQSPERQEHHPDNPLQKKEAGLEKRADNNYEMKLKTITL